MMKRRTRTMIRAGMGSLVLAGLAAVSPGCNTVKGIGQDVTSAAEATEEAFSEDPVAPSEPARQPASTTEPYPKSKY